MQACPHCGEENPPKFRLCGYCGAQLAAPLPPAEERKVVTVFFSDLAGSTTLGETLDSESLRAVLTLYFDAMTAVIRRHGGTVEKFIGDAIMAVFGLPRIHEDDALRAVRAAAETRGVLAALNDDLEARFGVRLTNRTGINTGEVVAGDVTPGQRLVTGDTVNVAARLEQAAPPNDVIIGGLTYSLVRDAVSVEPLEPLSLKGKAERVPAYRLLEVYGVEGVQRRRDVPLVGREDELEAVRSAVDAAIAHDRCEAVTVFGDAGVGKTRLVTELVDQLGDDVTVLHGRCLSYGDGITFWPLAEIVRQAAGIQEDDLPELAVAKVRALTGNEATTARLSAAVGLTSEIFPVEETFLAARTLFEALAQQRPLIAIVDDLHWAETTLLSLLDYVVDHAAAPITVLGTARPDLLTSNPNWSRGERRKRVELDGLGDAAVASLLGTLLGEATLPAEIQTRIIEAADGNPLFVEQLVSMFVERGLVRTDGAGSVAAPDPNAYLIPPTIHALVASRLDLLDRSERLVVEPASVIGIQFATAAVRAIVAEPLRPEIGQHLASMVHKHLLRQNPDDAEGEDHRFHHVLIRETAYQGMLKRTRAELHERFVDWADAINAERDRAGEYEEISAYHLEQSYHYRAALGLLDAHGVALGRRASHRLANAGRRAFSRGDMPAAASLLRRATEVMADDDPDRVAILPDIAEALMETGAFSEALNVLEAAADTARANDWSTALGHASLVRLLVERYAGDEPGWGERARAAAESWMASFVAADDLHGQIKAWRILAWVHGQAGAYAAAADAARQVVELSQSIGDTRQEARGAISYAMAALYGATPIPEAIDQCDAIARSVEGDRRTHSHVLSRLAELYARNGQIAEARDAYRRAKRQLEELGSPLHAATIALNSWRVEVLAGNLAAAERDLREAFEVLERMGEHYHLSTVAAALARVRYLRGDLDDAQRLGTRAAQLATDDDVVSQTLWRGVRARAAAESGQVAEAVTLAREAVALIDKTEDLLLQAEALQDLAAVLERAGLRDEAKDAAELAAAKARAKGGAALAPTRAEIGDRA